MFHEEPPNDYNEFLDRYADALYYLEHLGQVIALALYPKHVE